ncbi:MAG: hypothetical protein RL150_417 [Candidatus Parcubacteria bacterium]|jgi:hypothetical protein
MHIPIPIYWSPVQVDLSLVHHPILTKAALALPDYLYNRLHRFMSVMQEMGALPQLEPALQILVDEQPRCFHAQEYTGIENPHFSISGWCGALEHLQHELRDVSPILWRSIASLSARQEPEVERTIIEVQDELPYAWAISDAALHALGKSYALLLKTQSDLFEATGMIFVHGCGCNHYIASLNGMNGKVEFTLTPDMQQNVAREWFDHFLSELYLIIVAGFPFRMNPPEHESLAVMSGQRPNRVLV